MPQCCSAAWDRSIPPQTEAGKVFAGLYALYAGLVFLLIVGLVFTPVIHRLLHKFHWDQQAE
jgi:hypothetical protein